MRSIRTVRLLAASLAVAGSLGLSGAPAVDPAPVKVPPAAAKVAGPADEKELRAMLKGKSKFAGDGELVAVKDVIGFLAKEHALTVRLDLAAFKRFNPSQAAGNVQAPVPQAVFVVHAEPLPDDVQTLLDVKIRMPAPANGTLADLLTDLCAQLPGHCSYRVRHNQVLIGPAYIPPVVPGSGSIVQAGQMAVPQSVLTEQLLGESVSVALEEKSLVEAVAELRKMSGANIVLDARAKDKSKQLVSGTFDDARLFTVLELLADMCDLKVVSNNNVFYITSPDNAAKFQKQLHRDLFGEPSAVPPNALLTGEPKK